MQLAKVWKENATLIKGAIVVIACMVIIGLIFSSIMQGYKVPQPTPPVGLNIVATPAPEVKKVAVVDKPIKAKAVKVYPATVKKSIKLPEAIQDNPALDVIASNQVPADDHPQTITTLINTDTGESQTFVKRDPLPWLALDSRGEAGLYMGIKNGQPAARLEVKQGMFQVKALHFGVVGTVDQPINSTIDPDYFVGAGVWARW
ncbi:MAG: hypothetical protein Q8J66_09200 [Methylotenera sp.]|nr:hypothetical protein [Methylotenera sp.]